MTRRIMATHKRCRASASLKILSLESPAVGAAIRVGLRRNAKTAQGDKPPWTVGMMLIEEAPSGRSDLRGRDRRRRGLDAVSAGCGNRDTNNEGHAEHDIEARIQAQLRFFHACRSPGGKRLRVARQCGRAGQGHGKYQ